MARQCDLCGRGPLFMNQRSHSNIKTRRTQDINLQQATVDGNKKRVCAKCLKSMHK